MPLHVLHLNGADGSTTVVDDGSTPASWVLSGGAEIDTAQSVFGGAAALIPTNGNLDGTIAALGADWTVEQRVRFAVASGTMPIMQTHAPSGYGFFLIYSFAGGGTFHVYAASMDGTFDISGGTASGAVGLAADTWYHIAVVKDSAAGAYYIYVDGVLKHTITSALLVHPSATSMELGETDGGFSDFNGWKDEVLIWDTCEYPGGTTFTPPASEFSGGGASYSENGDVGVTVGTAPELAHVHSFFADVGAVVNVAGELEGPAVYEEEGDVGVVVGVTGLLPYIGNVGVTMHPVSEHAFVVRRRLAFVSPYRHAVKTALAAPYAYAIRLALISPYGLVHSVKATLTAPYAFTSNVRKSLTGVYDLSVVNRLRMALKSSYALSASSVQVITEKPYIMAGARRMEVVEASISTEASAPYWNARIRLASIDDFYSLERSELISLFIQGDEWVLAVESLGKNRSSRTGRTFDVTAMSPAWLVMGSDAEPITKSWDAVGARDVVEELAGIAVDWQIIDWTIPARRLSAVQSTRADVARQVVETAGAVLESMPDGSLRVRYAYPVTLPEAAAATPAHVLLEAADIVNLRDAFKAHRVFNAITYSDEAGGHGYLEAERDPFQQDDILPGEMQRYIVWLDDKTEVIETILSDGELVDLGTRIDDIEEQLNFADTDTAALRRPVLSDFAWTWYGEDLGDLTVNTDKRSVTADVAGIAIARVTYKAMAHVYAVKAPLESGGRKVFPILVYVIGAIK